MFIKESFYIRMPQAPAIPGLAFRHLRGPQDFALMAELVNAANEADGVPEASSVESMAHYYANPRNLEADRDVLIGEVDGQPVSYSRVYWHDDADGLRTYRSGIFMHPTWRNHGIGRAIVAFNEQRIRMIAASHPLHLPKQFEILVPDAQIGAQVLLQEFGYRVVRHFFTMTLPLLAEVPSPELPAGVELRPVETRQLRPIWDAMEEAFVDHWGFLPHDEDDYSRWLARPNTDTSLWKVAWAGDEVAGLALNYVALEEAERIGVLQAWTEPLAVRRPWRRRGLGRALLLASQREMRARGIQAAALEVDTENPNQALHLYESCGYRAERRWDLYRKDLN